MSAHTKQNCNLYDSPECRVINSISRNSFQFYHAGMVHGTVAGMNRHRMIVQSTINSNIRIDHCHVKEFAVGNSGDNQESTKFFGHSVASPNQREN
jgi:hypothetical protein